MGEALTCVLNADPCCNVPKNEITLKVKIAVKVEHFVWKVTTRSYVVGEALICELNANPCCHIHKNETTLKSESCNKS